MKTESSEAAAASARSFPCSQGPRTTGGRAGQRVPNPGLPLTRAAALQGLPEAARRYLPRATCPDSHHQGEALRGLTIRSPLPAPAPEEPRQVPCRRPEATSCPQRGHRQLPRVTPRLGRCRPRGSTFAPASVENADTIPSHRGPEKGRKYY